MSGKKQANLDGFWVAQRVGGEFAGSRELVEVRLYDGEGYIVWPCSGGGYDDGEFLDGDEDGDPEDSWRLVRRVDFSPSFEQKVSALRERLASYRRHLKRLVATIRSRMARRR